MEFFQIGSVTRTMLKNQEYRVHRYHYGIWDYVSSNQMMIGVKNADGNTICYIM